MRKFNLDVKFFVNIDIVAETEGEARKLLPAICGLLDITPEALAGINRTTHAEGEIAARVVDASTSIDDDVYEDGADLLDNDEYDDEHCDCLDRSWYGNEHDTACTLAGLPRVVIMEGDHAG
jgi:hypothetical protein